MAKIPAELQPVVENGEMTIEQHIKWMRGLFLGVYGKDGKLIAPGILYRIGRLESWMKVGIGLALALFAHAYFGLSFQTILDLFKALAATLH